MFLQLMELVAAGAAAADWLVSAIAPLVWGNAAFLQPPPQ